MTKVDSEGWIQWSGGEMPVEKGTLIDVKYLDCVVNLHVEAGGNFPSNGSVITMAANRWTHTGADSDIIAYRINEPKQQKTQQQLALEKFGTDWHDNEGVQPVDSRVMVDLIMSNGDEKKEYHADYWSWHTNQRLPIKKWRVHSDEKESQISEKEKTQKWLSKPMPPCSAEIPCNFVDVKDGPMASEPVRKSPLSTQIGGDHYTKLAIQPMQYSMNNRLDPLQHTIIKYVTRFRDKTGIEDLEKAKHCIDMLIEFEKESK
jgi:hypothetical protein